jgi:hypothetical protein
VSKVPTRTLRGEWPQASTQRRNRRYRRPAHNTRHQAHKRVSMCVCVEEKEEAAAKEEEQEQEKE